MTYRQENWLHRQQHNFCSASWWRGVVTGHLHILLTLYHANNLCRKTCRKDTVWASCCSTWHQFELWTKTLRWPYKGLSLWIAEQMNHIKFQRQLNSFWCPQNFWLRSCGPNSDIRTLLITSSPGNTVVRRMQYLTKVVPGYGYHIPTGFFFGSDVWMYVSVCMPGSQGWLLVTPSGGGGETRPFREVAC